MITDPELLAAERAINEVRCGRAILLRGDAGTSLYAAIETIDGATFAAVRAAGDGACDLILTPQRATALGVGAGAAGAVAVALPHDITLERAAALASCALVSGSGVNVGRLAPLAGLAGNGVPAARTGSDADRAAILLLKTAWLLPAALRASVPPQWTARLVDIFGRSVLLEATLESVLALAEAGESKVVKISEASIPLTDAPEARFLCFRSAVGSREHLAVLIGQPSPTDAIPVRLHSACLTGDVFGSLRCDCGEQLRQSVAALSELGGGVLLYLGQEGRGIGLANKLRAYALQDGGRDTIDADLQLGFEPDERRYSVAAAMLLAMGYPRIRLMTNNPDKIEALQRAGITIVERLPLLALVTPQNRRYMDAKRTRARHLLEPTADLDPIADETC